MTNIHQALRPTTPAPASFEERQVEDVRRGRLTIEEAVRNVEKYRELQEMAASRLLTGT